MPFSGILQKNIMITLPICMCFSSKYDLQTTGILICESSFKYFRISAVNSIKWWYRTATSKSILFYCKYLTYKNFNDRTVEKKKKVLSNANYLKNIYEKNYTYNIFLKIIILNLPKNECLTKLQKINMSASKTMQII